jgi:lipid biosynthesis B12-binding/radical SAM protein
LTAAGRKIGGDCLLVSANRMTLPYPVYPIGLAHLLGALQLHGHRADHVDILAAGGLALLEKHLQERRYDILGVSIRNIDTVDSANPLELLADITEVVKLLRKHSTAPVVLGGPGFSIMPEQLLDHFQADYGIIGEGEAAFPRLIDRIIAGERPRQRLFAEGLKNFPDCRPIYSAEVTPYYVAQGGMLNVQSKRGCVYGCSYCSYPAIEGKRLRFRDTGAVVDEFQRLCGQAGARYIFFTDSVFNDPDEHYLQIAEGLVRAKNTTPWCAFFRPQNLKRATLRLLKRSGMAAMELGTDAASDPALAGLNKGFTFAEVIEAHQAIVAEGIACAHFIMFGGPGETRETVQQGLANIEHLRRAVVFAYVGIRILPGTRLYSQALAEKSLAGDADLIRPVFYYSPEVAREFIEDRLRLSFRGKPDRIYPVAAREHVIAVLHRLGHVGPLWDQLIDNAPGPCHDP